MATPTAAAASPGRTSTGGGLQEGGRASEAGEHDEQYEGDAEAPAGNQADGRGQQQRRDADAAPTRIGLSALPKVATAHSLTGVGVASITADPTASTGEEAGLTRAATRWPTAMPATAARAPEAAYGQRLSW